jgi:hypothetical protein
VTPEFLLQLVIAVAAGAGVYAAIRADLTRAIVLAEKAGEEAGEAHKRLDRHMENHQVGTS